MFDLTPLSIRHLGLFGVAFGLVYAGIGWFGQRLWLRQVKHIGRRDIWYAGSVVLGVTAALDYGLLGNTPLAIGLLGASFLILVIGGHDEQVPLAPGTQLVWQFIIAGVAVLWGVTIQYVSHPSGDGIISLEWTTVGPLLLPGGLLATLWLVLMMNTVNWLDGVDGLAAGVSFIALLTLAAVSLLPSVQDSRTLALALIGAGAVLGFLLWNLPPARGYLGTVGSWWLGLYLGSVAIVGGGKVITTLLVLAIPVVDVLIVISGRWRGGAPLWQRDATRHLHFRLRAWGLADRAITGGAMVVTAGLGLLAITLQTQAKAVALVMAALAIITVSVAFRTAPAHRKNSRLSP